MLSFLPSRKMALISFSVDYHLCFLKILLNFMLQFGLFCWRACARIGLNDISVVDQLLLDFEQKKHSGKNPRFCELSSSTEDAMG